MSPFWSPVLFLWSTDEVVFVVVTANNEGSLSWFPPFVCLSGVELLDSGFRLSHEDLSEVAPMRVSVLLVKLIRS